jgi:alkanesulfonate monooxygenase SsuD/methylene tetrahydromethanopterin reductase-like flavin-dependent oxidoreductase (luciferase family)
MLNCVNVVWPPQGGPPSVLGFAQAGQSKAAIARPLATGSPKASPERPMGRSIRREAATRSLRRPRSGPGSRAIG